MVDMENEGVVGWPGFKTINFSDGLDTERQGGQAINRFGGNPHNTSRTEIINRGHNV